MNLSEILKGKVVIVGIGNALRADDGFGPALVGRLKDKVDAVCIDAGSAPENYIGSVIKEMPDTILLVDCVHMGLKPGEYGILTKSDILKFGFTTHDISPHLFIECLEGRTRASIYMLGVQPQNLNFGQDMSDGVKRALEEISGLIGQARNA